MTGWGRPQNRPGCKTFGPQNGRQELAEREGYQLGGIKPTAKGRGGFLSVLSSCL